MTPSDALLERPDVARLARRLAARASGAVEVDGPARWAAIALVLRPAPAPAPAQEAEDDLELLMIKRAELDRDPWSGHVACPGGRMEPVDPDLRATAVRETWEETGIDLEREGRVLGVLDDITPRTPSLPPLVIRPFVAVVTPVVTITPNPEVADAFWVPLPAIRAATSWGRAIVRVRGVGDREENVFRHGNYTVWGLTHRVLQQFLTLLSD